MACRIRWYYQKLQDWNENRTDLNQSFEPISDQNASNSVLVINSWSLKIIGIDILEFITLLIVVVDAEYVSVDHFCDQRSETYAESNFEMVCNVAILLSEAWSVACEDLNDVEGHQKHIHK